MSKRKKYKHKEPLNNFTQIGLEMLNDIPSKKKKLELKKVLKFQKWFNHECEPELATQIKNFIHGHQERLN